MVDYLPYDTASMLKSTPPEDKRAARELLAGDE
jgi:hypothetical protein